VRLGRGQPRQLSGRIPHCRAAPPLTLGRWADGNVIAQDWQGYQTEAAAFFRSLGLEADTDVRMKGVRTYHDVDVVARSHRVGFDIL